MKTFTTYRAANNNSNGLPNGLPNGSPNGWLRAIGIAAVCASLLLLNFGCAEGRAGANADDSAAMNSKIYLLRHTEKELDAGSDPALTAQGHARAAYLTKVLQYEEIKHVFSTDTLRTRATAKPFADSAGVEVQLYDAKSVDVAALLDQVRGGTSIVIGHSNTIPKLANALLGEVHYQDLDEADYDSLYLVTINGNQSSAARLYLPFQLAE